MEKENFYEKKFKTQFFQAKGSRICLAREGISRINFIVYFTGSSCFFFFFLLNRFCKY